MSDDLSNFFAKKAAKKEKKKKGGIVKIEDVGTALERRTQHKEEDLANRENAQADAGDDEVTQRKPDGEESEWLDFAESKMRLAEVGLKDMNLTQQVEEQLKEEGEKKAAANAEPVKTWNMERSNSKDEEEPPAEPVPAPVAPTEARKYRPPGSGLGRMGKGKGANLDLANQDMFPSFAAAEKMEKETALKKEEKVPATKSAWSVSTRSQPFQRTTEVAPTSTRNAFNALHSHSENSAPTVAAPPKKGSYVPPHLRKQTQQN